MFPLRCSVFNTNPKYAKLTAHQLNVIIRVVFRSWGIVNIFHSLTFRSSTIDISISSNLQMKSRLLTLAILFKMISASFSFFMVRSHRGDSGNTLYPWTWPSIRKSWRCDSFDWVKRCYSSSSGDVPWPTWDAAANSARRLRKCRRIKRFIVLVSRICVTSF